MNEQTELAGLLADQLTEDLDEEIHAPDILDALASRGLKLAKDTATEASDAYLGLPGKRTYEPDWKPGKKN